MTKIKKDMFMKIFYNDIDTLTNILLAEKLIEDGPIFNHSRAMDWVDEASDAEKLRILEKMPKTMIKTPDVAGVFRFLRKPLTI